MTYQVRCKSCGGMVLNRIDGEADETWIRDYWQCTRCRIVTQVIIKIGRFGMYEIKRETSIERKKLK